jgi:hypothetical protein
MFRTFLLLTFVFLLTLLPAGECFSVNGIAANFVDISGKWCGTE